MQRLIVVAEPEDRGAIPARAVTQVAAEIQWKTFGHELDSDPAARVIFTVVAPTEPWSAVDAVVRIRERHPLAPVLVCFSPPGPRPVLWRAMARAGADRLLSFDTETTMDAVRSELRRRFQHTLAALGDPLIHRLPEGTVPRWCLREAFHPLNVTDIARHFDVDRKTIYRGVRRDGWPSAECILGLARLTHVAAALETSEMTIQSIAGRLGFSTPSALIKLVRRMTGCAPTELRRSGPMRTALDQWSKCMCSLPQEGNDAPEMRLMRQS